MSYSGANAPAGWFHCTTSAERLQEGEDNFSGIDKECEVWYVVSVNDGTIVICAEGPLGYGVTSNRVYLYNKNFQLLFQEEEA